MIFMELIQNVYYRQFFNTKHFICSMYTCMLFIFALSYYFPCHLTLTAQKCDTTASLGQMIWQSARVSTCHAICPLGCYGELWFTYNGSLWGEHETWRADMKLDGRIKSDLFCYSNSVWYAGTVKWGNVLSLHFHCISHVIWCWNWMVAYHRSYYVLWHFPY